MRDDTHDEFVDKVRVIAHSVDNAIAELLDIVPSPLSVTTIILSRLMLANDHAGSGPEFRALMKEVADKHFPNAEEIH